MWDVFDSERLEVLRDLSGAAIRAALVRGELRDDDLARLAGSSEPWVRISELPALIEEEDPSAPPTTTPSPPPRPTPPPPRASQPPAPPPMARPAFSRDGGHDESLWREDEDDPPVPESYPIAEPRQRPAPDEFAPLPDEDEDDEDDGSGSIEIPRGGGAGPKPRPTPPAPPPATTDEGTTGPAEVRYPSQGPPTLDHLFDDDEFGPPPENVAITATPAATQEEPGRQPAATANARVEVDDGEEDEEEDDDEAAANFTLSRAGPERVEELDLAAMVDVAFQLVLFFLVTATTVLYKTLEIPRPNPPQQESQAGAEQGLDSPRTIEDLSADYIVVEVDESGAFQVDRQPVTASFEALAERLRQARRDSGRTGMLLTAQSQTLHRNAVLAYDAANDIGLRIAVARPSGGASAAIPRPPAAAVKAAEATATPAAVTPQPAAVSSSGAVIPAF